ncbi:Genome sequencing data, contig C299 [Microcystis aeruginosa PCC 9809]|uniref:Genome sequencing data, contig C299 n=1 Tax=Microcystis aeruginosa PCC 9809 TaxID=1160285 RepID=I4I1F1_MICAE|nr:MULTISPECIES: PIN domain-containing protein [Microcystis]MCE2673002.1 PIN domain-containing protein [Microcystis sp. 53598_E5]NCQ98019.1 PIN domain-containing protein [Microcystis aeruginosa L211-11]NCR31719.1 PIN domain-containing protein [Microcystis aeruginosa L211-101]REJ39246.1 MAG: PIN domain-containing protein [Microcystis flos-aquae DF17]MDJ0671790.1 PIN domain-containing protein [Microcystis sp. M53598_WE2]
MKRVLFDSDVLLDVLGKREPHFQASVQALNTVKTGKTQGYISGHAVTNIYYILSRENGRESSRKLVIILLENLQVARVTDAIIRQALASQMKDFEDAVTSAVAESEKLEIIIMRNLRDFAAAPVPAMLPADFLSIL